MLQSKHWIFHQRKVLAIWLVRFDHLRSIITILIEFLLFPLKDAHFVEQRRQRLQVYLRHLLALLPDVSSCTTRSQLEQAFPFFK